MQITQQAKGKYPLVSHEIICTLFIQIDFPIHFGTLNMCLSILYFIRGHRSQLFVGFVVIMALVIVFN